LQEQSQLAKVELATASRYLSPVTTAIAPLLRVFAAGLLFLFNVLSWDFFGGFLESMALLGEKTEMEWNQDLNPGGFGMELES